MSSQQVQPLTSKSAYDLTVSDPRALLVDIRSTMEFLFVGHPAGAIHVPWIDEPDWTINPNFVADIRKLLLGGAVSSGGQHSAPIILICRSGKRSKEAGQLLIENGLNPVYHIDEGFEGELNEQHQRSTIGGWRYHGLPWEQC